MTISELSLDLHRFLQQNAAVEAERETVLALAAAASRVSALLGRGPRAQRTGTTNVHGEAVRDLDLVANELFVKALSRISACGSVVSEELPEPRRFQRRCPQVQVYLDPLDGSANLDSHGLSGSIFGIGPILENGNVLTRGWELRCAGYFLYSSCTLLVLADKKRVDLFVHDRESDRFVLAEPNVRCPPRGTLYSLNESRVPNWQLPARNWLAALKAQLGSRGNPRYTLRYSGALVADAHRVLLEGGVFAYPEDAAYPRGKLRLLYEVNPLAFVFETARGAATTGCSSPLTHRPEHSHERSAVVLGSQEEVSAYEKAHAILRGA